MTLPNQKETGPALPHQGRGTSIDPTSHLLASMTVNPSNLVANEVQPSSKISEQSLVSVAMAYGAIWLILFLFITSIALRYRNLGKKIRTLHEKISSQVK